MISTTKISHPTHLITHSLMHAHACTHTHTPVISIFSVSSSAWFLPDMAGGEKREAKNLVHVMNLYIWFMFCILWVQSFEKHFGACHHWKMCQTISLTIVVLVWLLVVYSDCAVCVHVSQEGWMAGITGREIHKRSTIQWTTVVLLQLVCWVTVGLNSFVLVRISRL